MAEFMFVTLMAVSIALVSLMIITLLLFVIYIILIEIQHWRRVRAARKAEKARGKILAREAALKSTQMSKNSIRRRRLVNDDRIFMENLRKAISDEPQ